MAAPNRNGFETGRRRTDRKRQGKHDGHDCGNICCYMTLKCVSSSMFGVVNAMAWFTIDASLHLHREHGIDVR